MKSYKFSEKEIRSFLYWAITHEIERGLDQFDKNLKNKLEFFLNEKDNMNEQQHCTQLITQIMKYANSCVTKFKKVGNECYMSKNMAEFIEKYGTPFFNKPSIPSNEYGTLNATIKVFIDETLEDHQFIVGVAGTDNKIEFELRKN